MKTKQLTHIDHQVSTQDFPVILVTDGVTSPANAGGMIRVAEAFAIKTVYFCGSEIKLDSARFKRTSRKTEAAVTIIQEEAVIAVLKKLKAEGYTILALELTSTSKPIQQIKTLQPDKFVLVVGNEQTGVTASVLALSDHTFHIPMYGQNSSMNVGHATAIGLYELINLHTI